MTQRRWRRAATMVALGVNGLLLCALLLAIDHFFGAGGIAERTPIHVRVLVAGVTVFYLLMLFGLIYPVVSGWLQERLSPRRRR